MIEHYAKAVGAYAFEVIDHPQTGQVWGVTSAGVFIKTDGRVLFLTEENRRGPVTINLPGRCPWLDGVQVGEPVTFGGGSLALPESGLVIHTGPAQIWRLPMPGPDAWPDWSGAQKRLASLAAVLLSARPGKGLSWLLKAWVAGGQEMDPELDPLGIYEKARNAGAALAERSVEKTAAGLIPLLGYGPGLTPSGDDFVLGILLLQNHWFAGGWGPVGLSELNALVIAAAQKTTTALSATLIECAAEGQADEGLVRASDYLVTGMGDEGACVAGLLGWGSNSGIDTLAGMAVAIDLQRI